MDVVRGSVSTVFTLTFGSRRYLGGGVTVRKEMELLRLNSVPQREFDPVSSLYAEASTKLTCSQ